MVHEIREKNLFELIKQSSKEIGPRTLLSYAFLAVFVVVIGVTFLMSQTRQNIIQSASYDASSRTFTETFDGTPSTPALFTQIGQNIWDVQIHGRDSYLNQSPMDAMHGPDCSAPPAVHHTTGTYEEGVFNCRNHLMTAVDIGGYAVIYLTPNAMVDFGSEAVVQFELSTGRTSTRDWWDVTISPFTDAQALPLKSDLSQGVDLQGPNVNSIVITTDNGEGSPNLKVIRNGQETRYSNGLLNLFQGITPGTNEFATRQTYKLTLTKTRVKFERLVSPTATALPIFDQTIPELSWSNGVVQLGHHSYTPGKGENPSTNGGADSGLPNTWHWDAVRIQPAIPFSMIKTNKRFINSNTTLTFNSPAPANSYLRFSGICGIRVDGVLATKQTDIGHEEHSSSYFIPIAEGKQSFNFTFERDGWFFQQCNAKDFAIWSTTVSGTSNPTTNPTGPTPTSTPSPTAPQIPTATVTQPTPTPTRIPTPTNIPTPVAQSTLNISPANGSFGVGQTFTSEVRINTNGQTVNGIETTVNYPTSLQVVSVTNGTSFEIEAEKTLSSGRAVLAYGTTTPKSGAHTVATITFRVISPGTANVTLAYSAVAHSTSNTDVLSSTSNASYILIQPTPTPTPTPAGKQADLNRDGKIDIQDLSYLLTKWGTNDTLADLNKDTKVNTFDLSMLLSNWGK